MKMAPGGLGVHAVRKSKFTDEQMAFALKQAELGISVEEVCRKMGIKEITETRVHYGYRCVHVLLRREGHRDNVKRVYRLYREEGLSLRLKRPMRTKVAKLRPLHNFRRGES